MTSNLLDEFLKEYLSKKLTRKKVSKKQLFTTLTYFRIDKHMAKQIIKKINLFDDLKK